MRFNPKLALVKYMAQIKFNSMSRAERIAQANLRTNSVSDLVILTGMDITTEVFLDLADRTKKDGKTWLARVGSRWVTVFNGGMGIPSAESALTALHLAGARKVIRVGVGNTLNSRIHIGDLFVPTDAYIVDEVSRKYTDQTNLSMDCELLDFVRKEVPVLAPSDVAVHFGTVTSCNYLFAQTQEELEEWSHHADFVDMESAFIAAFCRSKGIEGMAVLMTSDDKLHGKDLFSMDDFPMAKLFENGDFLLRALIRGIRDYNADKPRN